MTGLARWPRDPSRTTLRRRVALLVLTTAAVVSCGRSGGDPPGTASSTPPPSAASTPTGEPPAIGPDDAVRTVVVSDQGPSSTAGGPAWPDLLANGLAGAGIPMSVVTAARDGAGFTSSPAFADLVAGTAEGSTQLVVLFDSRLAGTDTLSGAAQDTFTEVERAAPDAMLVVVGPLTAEDATASATGSAELAAATQQAGGTYVDPRAEGWSPDVTQAELAELLRLQLQPLVEVLAASGANR